MKCAVGNVCHIRVAVPGIAAVLDGAKPVGRRSDFDPAEKQYLARR